MQEDRTLRGERCACHPLPCNALEREKRSCLLPGDAAGRAPAPAPALGADTTDVVYMQQSGNVQLTASGSAPGAGMLFMNNALDTTLFDQQVPLRKIGKTSSNNFLNAASNGTQWFSPPPLGVLLGFNTSANVYMLLALSAPTYNFTTNTVTFNFSSVTPAAATASQATNGFLANYYLTSLGDHHPMLRHWPRAARRVHPRGQGRLRRAGARCVAQHFLLRVMRHGAQGPLTEGFPCRAGCQRIYALTCCMDAGMLHDIVLLVCEQPPGTDDELTPGT